MRMSLSHLPLCTGLVQKAKKAKDKLLKRDGDDRPDTGSYESFYYGGVDPYMWEPQELGKTERTDPSDSSEVCPADCFDWTLTLLSSALKERPEVTWTCSKSTGRPG